MSVGYQAVGWNRQKKIYDRVLVLGVVLYLAVAVGVSATLNPNATAETLIIRAFGTGAFVLLHVVLSVGPLCRLDRRFLPLLYNRRHMGVTMFLMALVHGVFSLLQFHLLGNVNPLISLFTSSANYTSLAWFPFQPLGFFALIILFLMAATSHDFWLANLSAPVWKALHMLVYVAYALLIGHVVLGVLQAETSPLLVGLTGIGALWIVGIHLAAGWRERGLDEEVTAPVRDDCIDVCSVDDIPEKRAKIVTLSGERVAVFRYDGKVSAISNVCKHQNGPLGEGRVIDGCVTCPWHGYQYRPDTGTSPPPFTETVPTYDVRVEGDRVLVNPKPHAPGTPVEPARISTGPRMSEPNFYIGYQDHAPADLGKRTRFHAWLLLVLVLGAAVAISVGFRTLPSANFEFGNIRTFSGTIVETPYPGLLVERPGVVEGLPSYSRYHLVGFGKFGADEEVRGLDGRAVTLEGTLVFRDGQTMIEVTEGSVTATDATPIRPSADEPLGRHRLVGEVVDSKCFLGVMNPGNLKPHRACASLCISGGIPPVLCVRDEEGRAEYFLLVDEEGMPVNDRVLDIVAEPIEIEGEVVRIGEQLVLRANPEEYRRL